VALQLNDPLDYGSVVGRTGGLVPAPGVRGRGLVRGQPPLEFQTALPAPGATEVEQSATLQDLVNGMAAVWTGPRAPALPVLPEVIPLCQLVSHLHSWTAAPDQQLEVPLGLDAATLQPVCINLADGPHFVITSPPESGKTTLLQTWLLALAECYPPERVVFYLIGTGSHRLMPLRSLPHTAAYVQNDDECVKVLETIDAALEERRQALASARLEVEGVLDESAFLARYPILVFAADDFDQFVGRANETNQQALAMLMEIGRNLGFCVLAAGPTRVFASYGPLVRAIKEGRTGFLLGSSDREDLGIFDVNSVQLPAGQWGKSLLPGRGFFLRRGRALPLQTATCHAGEPGLVEWIRQIAGKRTSDQRAARPKSPAGGE
jgi:S-DNA-T family DNA segregation ATPase FtsK/SpoIIIE